jgi:hypothetical protein
MGPRQPQPALCGVLAPCMPEPKRRWFCLSWGRRFGPLHKQLFDPLKPKAGVARTLVDFDPRRAAFA